LIHHLNSRHMHYSTVRRERQVQRHAWILTVALHLSLAAMLYFKATSGAGNAPKPTPVKGTDIKEHLKAAARVVSMA
jgi:hypothetical protein